MSLRPADAAARAQARDRQSRMTAREIARSDLYFAGRLAFLDRPDVRIACIDAPNGPDGALMVCARAEGEDARLGIVALPALVNDIKDELASALRRKFDGDGYGAARRERYRRMVEHGLLPHAVVRSGLRFAGPLAHIQLGGITA